MIKIPLTSIKVGHKFKLTDSPTAPFGRKGKVMIKTTLLFSKARAN